MFNGNISMKFYDMSHFARSNGKETVQRAHCAVEQKQLKSLFLETPCSCYGIVTCSFDGEPCSRSRGVHSFLLQPPLLLTARRSQMVMMALRLSFLLFLKRRRKKLPSPARRYYILLGSLLRSNCLHSTLLFMFCNQSATVEMGVKLTLNHFESLQGLRCSMLNKTSWLKVLLNLEEYEQNVNMPKKIKTSLIQPSLKQTAAAEDRCVPSLPQERESTRRVTMLQFHNRSTAIFLYILFDNTQQI